MLKANIDWEAFTHGTPWPNRLPTSTADSKPTGLKSGCLLNNYGMMRAPRDPLQSLRTHCPLRSTPGGAMRARADTAVLIRAGLARHAHRMQWQHRRDRRQTHCHSHPDPARGVQGT
ncbi:hypothetical protein GCM10010327_58280 [Streptomyces nitrosporeus]|nr:hypothetical protein GCM10010327_58280 [Streptomyces nitrosporeus]